MPSISVIICTYNPNPSVFANCLEALDGAIKKFAPAEVLIIDNNSTEPVGQVDFVGKFLAEHTSARIVREERPGLTHARLRGIRESKGEILIFVDDDNFISADYLQQASTVADKYPFIGAFSGQVELTYTKEPPQWTRRYWGMLVHRKFKGNYWGNTPFNDDFMPNGAGMCIRRKVGEEYLLLHENGKRNFTLDRTKDSLISGGDNDLAMVACDIGLGMGLFESLYLKHFIPESRFSLDYFTRLTYGIYYSAVILKFMRTGQLETENRKRTFYNKVRNVFLTKEQAAVNRALQAGVKDAKIRIKELNYFRT